MKLALIGDPVEHSKSPAIQRRLLLDAGIDGDYELIRVERGRSAAAIAALRIEGYDGCNVTFPLKEEIVSACDVLSPVASLARAVNTLAFRERIIGTCTDGLGAARALHALLRTLEQRSVVVLGTGPTARSVVCALQEEEASVCIWGRDSAKVEAICNALRCEPWAPQLKRADAVFSALLPGAQLPERVADAISKSGLVMDANYGERSTLATDLGTTVIDGSRMLEEQARASFEFWIARG
jgi:shikimate dehydrogenase